MMDTNNPYILKTWLNKAVTLEKSRPSLRAVYSACIAGEDALVASDGYRLHATWDYPVSVLVPSRPVANGIAVLDKRGKKVMGGARAQGAKLVKSWESILTPFANAAGILINATALRRAANRAYLLYAARKETNMPMPMYLQHDGEALNIHTKHGFITQLAAPKTHEDAQFASLVIQVALLRDALWIQGGSAVTLAQVAIGGASAAPLGIGIYGRQYAVIMPMNSDVEWIKQLEAVTE